MAKADIINVNRLVDDTLVLILAGGQGSRLYELTQSRAKPALEFACNYRIIDFPLSNCANSGLKRIGVITQYKSQCLIRHLVNGWSNYNRSFGSFMEIMPASQQQSKSWYQGTADSLYQNLEFIKSVQPKYVLVLSGDHVYKMDYRDILSKHAVSGADMTVSCIEVPVSEAAGSFGVMNVDNSDRVTSFEEKPLKPQSLADSPGNTLASMGNYVFSTEFLIEQLSQDASDLSSDHDFGKNIIPNVIDNYHIQAYRFRSLDSADKPYWRDVGTIDAYWKANMALLKAKPPFLLHDNAWPIWSAPACLTPAKILTDENSKTARFEDALVSAGSVIEPCKIKHSLISPNALIKRGASISDSILLPYVTVGNNVQLEKCIIDTQCVIPDGTEIGVNVKDDINRGFRISKNGVVLVNQAMLDELSTDKLGQTPKHQLAKLKSIQKVEPRRFMPTRDEGSVFGDDSPERTIQ